MSSVFNGWILGGFECSSHRRRDGHRLDMIASTKHEKFAHEDYRRLAELGIKTARDGLRWHLIEFGPGRFDFSSVAAQMDAAEKAGWQVIWDLFHYGYPDHVDIFAPDFASRFCEFAQAFARFHKARANTPLYFV